MEMSSPSSSHALSAQVVGNAFVNQYYHILHHSPEVVYRFYQDSSILSRPEANGVMTSVTTKEAINEKILSLDYKDYKSEIENADAQDSYKDGVLILVTGSLTGRDNLRRKFTQSFFLAPQENGYFVQNDVFRYVEENEPLEMEVVAVDGIAESISAVSLTRDPEDDDPPTSSEEFGPDGEVYDPQHNEEELVAEVDDIVEPQVHSTQNEVRPVIESDSLIIQEDAQKKSYASILKVLKGNTAPTPVDMPTNNRVLVPANTEQHSNESASKSFPEPSAPSSNNGSEIGNTQEEVEGHSIYIRHLPLNVTVFQLEEEFKKFGSIKPGGVQVISIKQQGFCFGFIEFVSMDSTHSAIQASPVAIGGRQALVEKKRSKTRVGSGRGPFPLRKGWFHNDNSRDRGNFGGGRGYDRRHEFGNRGDISGQGQGPSQRVWERKS